MPWPSYPVVLCVSRPSLTTSSFAPAPPEPKHFFPLTQAARFLPSPAISNAIVAKPTLDTPATIVPAQIAILYTARGIVGVDLAQLNLGQDHPRQPVEQLVHILSIESRHFYSNRYSILARPSRRRLGRDLAALRGYRVRSMEICVETGSTRV